MSWRDGGGYGRYGNDDGDGWSRGGNAGGAYTGSSYRRENSTPEPPAPPAPSNGAEAFVTYAQGKLKVFNSHKNFGFICPVFRAEDSEGPPLKLSSDEGLWFFGNHNLPPRTQLGTTLSFEVWENSDGKPQARSVDVHEEQPVPEEIAPSRSYGDYGGYGGGRDVDRDWRRGGGKGDRARGYDGGRQHVNEPRVIYPSVYISDVPVEYTEDTLRELHKQLGLNPDTIMGIKFLPFTEVSLGTSGEAKSAAPVTGAVILRYCNEEAAHAACDRLKGHPIRTSSGVTKYLGARHAAPAKWMMERKVQEAEDKKTVKSQGETLGQKVRGFVARVSAAGYGVIKSQEFGEVMWRQYELPTNLRSLQFADPKKFQEEAQGRPEYKRLKEMEGREVEAELYRLPDQQLRASHVRVLDLALAGPDGEDGGGGAGKTAQAPDDKCIVCVYPVPLLWTHVELRERFELHGTLVDASVERRVYNPGGGKMQPPEPPLDDAEIFNLGVVRFEDPAIAEEVINQENGGSLDSDGGAVTVELGKPRRMTGWCEGVVVRYLPDHGVGLMRSAQVEGDIHFEAPEEARNAGLDLMGMLLDAKVEYMSDGSPDAKEVRMKGHAPPKRPNEDGEEDRPMKKSKGEHGQASGSQWAGAWGNANDPYYKTQPCPYQRQGNCQVGQGCYFAHSPKELRQAPEAMMMNPFAMMMGQQVPKKKKDKRTHEKKAKRECSREPSYSRAGGRSRSAGRPTTAPRYARNARGSQGKKRVKLNDEDF